MIRLADATILALTKLRTRKVRTIVTVATASLLFGVLVLATLLVGGVVDSAKRFTKGGLSERYITNVQYFDNGMQLYGEPSPELEARANEIYNQLVADKTREAKRIGVDYDPLTEQKPLTKDPDNSVYLDYSSPAATQAVREKAASLPQSMDKVKSAAGSYHPKSFYEMKTNAMPGKMSMMKGGIEDFNAVDDRQAYSSAPDVKNGWSYLDTSITKQFLLDKTYLDSQTNVEDLPIIAPYSKVETALGLKKLPKSATPKEQLERVAYVRKHAAKATFVTCYRNEASSAQIDLALRTSKEIEQNRANKDYQKPSLIYGLPSADSCGAATILRDVRTAGEKKQIEKQLQFDRLFGSEIDPVQQKVTFRVVGIGPDGFSGDSFSNIDMLISAVAGASLQGAWVVPQDMYDALPNKQDYAMFDPASAVHNPQTPMFMGSVQLVEFATAADAKAFSASGCNGMDCGDAKPYITHFGSNSVLLSDIVTSATKALGIAVLIVTAVASLIMMGMVGRVIGDSRRETAVFRAIGAKRNDIRMIYTVYTVALSFLIAVAALLIGTVAALWIDQKWAVEATARAQITFIGVDGSEQFRLLGVWWSALGLIVVAIIAAGLTSMLLPLSRNLARSPIRDMRDDT
ncbi:MAG: ABC transporter permease [Candidatus Saccharimonadales bacterium]